MTSATHALHPPSNVETIVPTTLHFGGEFADQWAFAIKILFIARKSLKYP